MTNLKANDFDGIPVLCEQCGTIITKESEEAAENGLETIQNKTKGKLLSWLDHQYCDCGAVCKADYQYVESQALYMQVWDCPECENRYFREEDPLSFDMWD